MLRIYYGNKMGDWQAAAASIQLKVNTNKKEVKIL